MKGRIDERIGRKFTIAAGILMTRVFSTPLTGNERRLAFAAGPVSRGGRIAPPDPGSKFDVVGLGFTPGREWRGPGEVFVEERRDGLVRVWTNCRFWADQGDGPLYLLTEDPQVSFSYDGHSLIALSGTLQDADAGARLAAERLRDAARRLPNDVEQHRMM